MAESEEDEYWRLRTAVSQIEAVVANGAVGTHSQVSSILLTWADNARKRLDQIEHSGSQLPDNEKRQRDATQLVFAKYLVEKETALNSQERAQYEGFLSREFFTREDFGALEQFYAKSWDKLSEAGKAQMSYRIWEGARRDEYDFSELPEKVKEKEAQRLYEALLNEKGRPAELNRIPAEDSQGFVQAWKNGNREEAYQILNRPAFAENVALSPRVMSAENGKQQNTTERAEVAGGTSVTSVEAAPQSEVSSNDSMSEELLGKLNAVPKSIASSDPRKAETSVGQSHS